MPFGGAALIDALVWQRVGSRWANRSEVRDWARSSPAQRAAPISGRLREGDASPLEFHGRVELISLLDRAWEKASELREPTQ